MTIASYIAPAALAVAVLAAPAQATTVNISKQNDMNVFADVNGNNKWYVGTSFMVGSETRNNVGAGVFRVTGTDEDGVMSDFLAFCLQPLEYLTLPKVHTLENPFTAPVSTALQALAANAWSSVTDSVSAGAFQMAAWEIVAETGAYDIQSGTFKITGTGTASNAAEETAQDWLKKISSNEWTAGSNSFQIFTAAGTQDLLTNVPTTDNNDPEPVPLPATALMLLAGLFGYGGMAARRRKA